MKQTWWTIKQGNKPPIVSYLATSADGAILRACAGNWDTWLHHYRANGYYVVKVAVVLREIKEHAGWCKI